MFSLILYPGFEFEICGCNLFRPRRFAFARKQLSGECMVEGAVSGLYADQPVCPETINRHALFFARRALAYYRMVVWLC